MLIKAMLAGHVHLAPCLADPDVITAREEYQVNSYFSAVHMYGRSHAGSSVVPALAENLLPRFPE